MVPVPRIPEVPRRNELGEESAGGELIHLPILVIGGDAGAQLVAHELGLTAVTGNRASLHWRISDLGEFGDALHVGDE